MKRLLLLALFPALILAGCLGFEDGFYDEMPDDFDDRPGYTANLTITIQLTGNDTAAEVWMTGFIGQDGTDSYYLPTVTEDILDEPGVTLDQGLDDGLLNSTLHFQLLENTTYTGLVDFEGLSEDWPQNLYDYGFRGPADEVLWVNSTAPVLIKISFVGDTYSRGCGDDFQGYLELTSNGTIPIQDRFPIEASTWCY